MAASTSRMSGTGGDVDGDGGTRVADEIGDILLLRPPSLSGTF